MVRAQCAATTTLAGSPNVLVGQTRLAERFEMMRDIAIVSAHQSKPSLVLKGKCRLDAEGCIYLPARSLNLTKLHKVSR
jgi:hypothetical protein